MFTAEIPHNQNINTKINVGGCFLEKMAKASGKYIFVIEGN